MLLPFREAVDEDKNLTLSEKISSKLLDFTFKSFLSKDFSTAVVPMAKNVCLSTSRNVPIGATNATTVSVQ